MPRNSNPACEEPSPVSDKKTLLIVTDREWKIHKILIGLTVVNFLFFAFVAVFLTGAHKSVFDCICVEVPFSTQALWAVHDILTEYYYVVIPLLISGILCYAGLLEFTYGKLLSGQGNPRFLQKTYAKLFWLLIFVNCILFIATPGIILTLFMPMTRLVHSVG